MTFRLTSLLYFIFTATSMADGASVSLIVEGGVSLVGLHCPGTVRLVCEGVGLTFLRWQNNNNEDIHFFLPDSTPGVVTGLLNPAFVSVELISVTQSENRVFGSFSSALTVDLFNLEQQNVMNITCSDPAASDTVSVGVRIRPQSLPEEPQGVTVHGSFDSPSFVIVTISWNPPVVVCPDYRELIQYEVTLTEEGIPPLTKLTNGGTCTSACSVKFNLAPMGTGNFILQLQARNDAGESNVASQSVFIGTGRISEADLGAGIAAATIVTLILSLPLGFALGFCTYYTALRRCHCIRLLPKQARETTLITRHHTSGQTVELQQDQSYIKMEKAQRPKMRRAAAHSEPEATPRTQDMTHSYCEIDDPASKPPGVYSEPDANVADKVKLKPNQSYGEVNKEHRQSAVGVIKGQLKLKANESYGKIKPGETVTRAEYDYVDSELLGK